ncbi:unnamed protein product [Amaranthus hypochondriacus]
MGNSLRCCLACVIPCGALDLIRIVHLNGYVEEITRPVTAGEILQSYPNHVLTKPSSNGNNNMVRKIMILSSQSELKRGTIYFLIPDSSLPSDHSKSRKSSSKNKINGHKIIHDNHGIGKSKVCDVPDNITKNSKFLNLDLSTLENKENNVIVCETKLKSKSKLGNHQRRRSSRGKSGIWQPHLESITEDL